MNNLKLEIKTAVSIGIWNSVNNDRLPWSVIFKYDTVGIFNESDTDTSFDFTKLMPINAGDRIDKH